MPDFVKWRFIFLSRDKFKSKSSTETVVLNPAGFIFIKGVKFKIKVMEFSSKLQL